MSARYILGHKLAIGGMAEIFEARVLGAGGFEKHVVVKRILPHFAEDAGFRERFFQEARLAALLSHPNIVQTYELVEQDGDTLLAMEAVHGADVAIVLRVLREAGKAMPIATALFIAASIADALAYAHDKKDGEGNPLGLVHRDVTPSNVLISIDGVPKLIDFGIAKAVASSGSPHTQTGLVLGKAWYLSPEQCMGKPIDGKSDVFALGVLLFQMLAGRVPFGGRNGISAMEKIAAGRRPTLSALVPKVPKAVEAVVDAALTVDAAARPTAKALRAQLERALATVDPERRARDDVAELLRACLAQGSEGAPSRANGAAPTLLLMDLQSAAAQATDDDSDVATGDPGITDRTSTHAMPAMAPKQRSRRGLVGAVSLALVGAAMSVGGVLYVRDLQASRVVAVDRTPVIAPVEPAKDEPVEAPVIEDEPEDEPDVTRPRRARKRAESKDSKVEAKPVEVAPPKRVEKAAKIEGNGKVTIHSEPWAQVWLGGISLGMTWAGSVTVPAGKQTLFLKNPVTGHEKTVTVNVAPNSVQVLNVNLDRARKAPNH